MRPLALPGSLRLRFLLAISLWVAVGIAAIWISAVSVFRAHVEESYHEELEVHVRELARLARIGADGRLEMTRPLSDPRYEVPLSGFYWQVTAHGAPPLRSVSMTRGQLDESIAHSPDILHAIESGPTGPAITYGLVRKSADGRELHFVIATDQSELDRLVNSFTRDLTLWLVALGSLLLATGLAIISFGLHPLDRLGKAIARLRRGESPQLEGRYPAEIAPLASDLNEYIRQNGEMISRARIQAGNLAHSLRTPLAVVMDEAERLAARPELAQSGQALLDQAHMMEQQIEYHLARARSTAGAPSAGRASQLPELALPILAAMRRLHPEKTFALDTTGCEGVTVPLDPVDLSELLSILLDNAGKWASERVKFAIACAPDGALLATVSDDGPGMTEDQLAAAFDIGSRFDPDTPGSGLGLAIARDIAEAIGVELSLSGSPGGLVATVRMPPPPPGS